MTLPVPVSVAPGKLWIVPSTTWTVAACDRNIAELRRSVVDFARANGVPERRAIDVQLAFSEAATNAVVHAFRGARESGTLVVKAAVREHQWIDLHVADNGSGMAPRDDSPGLGLPLIRHLADRFDHRNPPGGGTDLWMRFTFR